MALGLMQQLPEADRASDAGGRGAVGCVGLLDAGGGLYP